MWGLGMKVGWVEGVELNFLGSSQASICAIPP